MTDPDVIAERYEVLSELGMGAVAVVYKVRDKYLNKEFALKMMRNEHASGEQLIRFQQEAMLVSKLQHTSISTVYHCGITDDNQPFLVMDFHDGKTLSDVLESTGPLPVKPAINVFLQICDGMSYSHERGILHRDLKTSNVMLTKGDNTEALTKVRILDFGLGKMTTSSGGVLTRPGMALGSPAYMSPEHAHGKVLDERSDVYSLGCIMFETLTGRAPIRGSTPVDTILKQISQPAPALSAVAPGKSFEPELERIVAACLEKEPANRFQSMDELRAALVAFIDRQEAQSQTATPTTVSQPKHVSTGTIIVSVVIALCVAAGVFFTFALIQDPHEEPLPAGISKGKDSRRSTLANEAFAGLPSTGLEEAPSKSKKQSESEDFFADWIDMPWEGGVTWKWNQLKVEDRELARISQLPNFAFVSLFQAKDVFTTEGLRALLHSRYLRGLGLGATGLTPEQLELVVQTAPHLEVLLLSDDPALGDKDLLKLKRMKQLRLLDLTKGVFTDNALKIVAQLPTVKILTLRRMPYLTGSGLADLAAMKGLRKLSLRQTELTARNAWSNLAQLQQLTVLSLVYTNMTDDAVDEISKLKLEKLDISMNSKLTDRCLEPLQRMKTLKHLYVVQCDGISNAARDTLKESIPGIEIHNTENTNDRSPEDVLIE